MRLRVFCPLRPRLIAVAESEDQRVRRIAKEAEDWLEANDPEYLDTSRDWRHVRGRDVLTPQREEPWDEDSFGSLGSLIGEGFKLVGAQPRRMCERIGCGDLFAPTRGTQRFCSDRCKSAAEQRRRRRKT